MSLPYRLKMLFFTILCVLTHFLSKYPETNRTAVRFFRLKYDGNDIRIISKTTKVIMDFNEFSLHETLMKGIADAGYVTCTPVQEQVLKGSLDGADLYVQSQTGTGKTAAYLISVVQELLTRDDMKGKKALIMVPTRELAVQVEQEAKCLSSHTGLKCASFYGGVGYTRQTEQLKKDVEILVGTPGRVIDLQESGTMDLSNVGFLVVDEADRMFDMGFYPDLRKLIKILPSAQSRQTMLFSATLNTYVKNLAWEYTEDAKEITIECEQITVDEIDQVLVHVSSDQKMQLLLGILHNEKPESTIVFCNTKRSCEVISKRLSINGIESEFIIGDLPQSKRLQVLESFKRGSLRCLVATDVAARGIDVNDLAMVINYDLPNESENYVHRIGRTARAGKSGKAYTFCSEQDVYNLPAIEKYIEKQIPSTVATDDMLATDKSAGMYIKTDSYGDDYSDRSQRGRSGSRTRAREPRSSQGRTENRSRAPSQKKYENSADRSSGRRNDRPYDEKNYGGRGNGQGSNRPSYSDRNKKSYETRNDQKRFAPKEAVSAARGDLSALPFEERMKLYKEKYGLNAEQTKKAAPGGKTPPSKKAAHKPSDKKSIPQKNNAGAVTCKQHGAKVQHTVPSVKKEEKKGIFSKLVSIFKKK